MDRASSGSAGPGQPYDWDPSDESVRDDQIAAYDKLRERCPVAHSGTQGWSLLRHEDVVEALLDPGTFSSRVSVHVAIPNGMDPPEHDAFREVVDACFTPALVDASAPVLAELAAELVARLGSADVIEVMAGLAGPYAAQAQCAYLGWPAEVASTLLQWSAHSTRATRSRDRAELDRIAGEFEEIITGILERSRAADPASVPPVMARLLSARVAGEPLSDGQLVSMLRNWTVGELGTIAAAIGIILEFLARRPDVQQLLRDRPHVRQAAMDEILRLHAPLIANRRRTARSVAVRQREIPADQRVTILWSAAQRDPHRFEDAAEFRLDRRPADNLLYGRGPHYCPGEGLSRLELGMLLDAFLDAVPGFTLAAAPVRETYPAGGFAEVRIAVAR